MPPLLSRRNGKRPGGGGGGSGGGRAKKKQKRLDSIVDKPAAVPEAPRRSSRVRRRPAILDSSPTPNRRKKRGRSGNSYNAGKESRISGGRRKGRVARRLEPERYGLKASVGGRRLSLRSSSIAARRELKRKLDIRSWEEDDEEEDDEEESKEVSSEEKVSASIGKDVEEEKAIEVMKEEGKSEQEKVDDLEELTMDFGVREECQADIEENAMVVGNDLDRTVDDQFEPTEDLIGQNVALEVTERSVCRSEQVLKVDGEDFEIGETQPSVLVDFVVTEDDGEGGEVGKCISIEGLEIMEECMDKVKEDQQNQSEDTISTKNPQIDDLNDDHVAAEADPKNTRPNTPTLNDKLKEPKVKEGRRCGLCGGGNDGRPPKKLVLESIDSDNEAYEGSSATEEPNYDNWDGFGNEPGWLGRLLGPIHDRFGIARVWVHQHCAVWSPEVYFAGLGCLKNVRAALSRGRTLKCSRCGRPGATIGCRVDRCPKTYHLPCSRSEGCIFDHKKFLIACSGHRHLFQAQGNDYTRRIRKLKARKLRFDYRKLWNDAMRKDLDAEEKWFENCGEDEEFLKRESKRLHRDILRIAPIYIGGSSESGKNYQGWESVAGLQDVIQCMKEVVILPLLYPELFDNLGLPAPKGLLLHGYPGTGKTLVVRALIGACARGGRRIAYFYRKGADCLGKYVGDSERQLRLLFQVAEKSQPSIIFFDEIDGLASFRSRQQDQTHNSVVSTLLSLMDGLKSRGSVIVIGATNRPDAVDPALRRPGRFDREIYFPLPSVKDRSSILELHTKNWPNPLSGPLLSWIAARTPGYAGADLQSLCTEAAMTALKRTCDLHQLLCSAEKGLFKVKLPSLPSTIVEERDWLTALASAPPPCSRREAGMAANDIVSSPLPGHLIPCLLEPLTYLLVLFFLDKRIWLPPSLLKASECVSEVVFSTLEERGISSKLWLQNNHSLSLELPTSIAIQHYLSTCGLVEGPSGFADPSMSDNVKVSCEKFEFFKFSRRSSLQFQRKLGFRVLVSGESRSGQQHLAGCLLHAFLGHIDVKKINMATILQEGHGDVIHGITQILLKCRNAERCLIYMPRIDLWALDDRYLEESETTSSNSVLRHASDAWSSFLELVDTLSISKSVIILATCEEQGNNLPLSIRQFFMNDRLRHPHSSSAHSIPRFPILLSGDFYLNNVMDASSEKLAQNLVQNYVQLVHFKTHLEKKKTTTFPGSLAETEQTKVIKMEKTQAPLSNVNSHQHSGVYFHTYQDSLPGFMQSKAMKATSSFAIATFGYQILWYPQFAELCWVTSKLKDGPCADTKGPWKGWPFNSCVTSSVHSSPNKAASRISPVNTRDAENTGVVRGLIAVGLSAFHGSYGSIGEVSSDVRKVLELLVERINVKIAGGKDCYHYLRLLSQVAYLEDLVNSWVYMLKSLQLEPTETPISNTTTEVSTVARKDNNVPIASTNVLQNNEATTAPEGLNATRPCSPCLSPILPTSSSMISNSGPPSTDLLTVNFKPGNSEKEYLCSYSCCPKCLQDLHIEVRRILLAASESSGRPSRVDDIHDVVAFCSSKIAAAVAAPKNDCCSSSEDESGFVLEGHCCHSAGEEAAGSEELKFYYRGGVLVNYNLDAEDADLHCRHRRVCFRALIDKVSMLKRPVS